MYAVGDLGLCTHGPDPAPPGVTASEIDPPAEFTAAAAAVCDGNGTSGKRVQVLYVRPSNGPDQFNAYKASFAAWAAEADVIYQESAKETGGHRYIRFVHDASCNITVTKVTLSSEIVDSDGEPSAYGVIGELSAKGYNRTDRKYLVYVDVASSWACGQGTYWWDSSPGQYNRNNTDTGHALVYGGCWSDPITAAHELGHTFGAVQSDAPNATVNGHCTDEYDVMCYRDGDGVVLRYLCSTDLMDCNHDDYFHTNPPTGNYLKTHWNVANSAWLGKTKPTYQRVTLDKEKSKYNGWVTATVTGFAPNTAVNVRWPGGTLLVQITTDATGAGSGRFRTPLVPLGDYTVSAIGGGVSARTTLRVIPRIMLAPDDSGPTGFRFRVYYYGFSPGERVEVQWYTTAGTTFEVLKTVTIADNGRGSTILYVPATAPTGKHMIRGKVIGVSRSASTTFTVTGPGIAAAPTATPSPTPTEPATPEPTETPIPAASPVIEETPTAPPTPEVLPTETPTP
jgi:hypothetical protein